MEKLYQYLNPINLIKWLFGWENNYCLCYDNTGSGNRCKRCGWLRKFGKNQHK